MSTGVFMRITILTVAFFFFLLLPLEGQEFTVLFYNVENLFDTEDDPVSNDDEFLPSGSRRWTASRYNKKLAAIARAVTAAGRWELPAIVGLCEVENEKVVRDLAYGTILSAGNYGIVHRDSPDARGIDLALLYRRDMFRVEEVRSWLPGDGDSITVPTRSILYVKISCGADTLHLMLCHLPSRRGGVLAAGELRERMGYLLRSKVDSVMADSGEKRALVVMGDFNLPPDDPLIKMLTHDGVLVNLAGPGAEEGQGSYRYQGRWEMIDQIMVSAAMTGPYTAFHYVAGSFRVADDPFLLTDDGSYPGRRPSSTYTGYRWSGGYSDHLPVLISLVK
jgi:hypothetical protein